MISRVIWRNRCTTYFEFPCTEKSKVRLLFEARVRVTVFRNSEQKRLIKRIEILGRGDQRLYYFQVFCFQPVKAKVIVYREIPFIYVYNYRETFNRIELTLSNFQIGRSIILNRYASGVRWRVILYRRIPRRNVMTSSLWIGAAERQNIILQVKDYSRVRLVFTNHGNSTCICTLIHTLKYWLANKATIVVRARRSREIIFNTFSSLFLECVSVNNG